MAKGKRRRFRNRGRRRESALATGSADLSELKYLKASWRAMAEIAADRLEMPMATVSDYMFRQGDHR